MNLRYYYSVGMSMYVQNNTKGYFLDVCNMIIDLFSEIYELWCEIIIFNKEEIIKEFYDVCHCLVQVCLFILTSPDQRSNPNIWYNIYPFVKFAAIKHALRQKEYGCIRNKRHCILKDHKC